MAINIFIVSFSINEILIFLLAFISSIILLIKKDPKKNIGIFFFIIGSISNFIDLLTAPLVTLGITAITYFLIIQKREEKANVKEYIIDLLKIGMSWALGYGITWISKWVITQLALNRPIVTQAIEQALFRSNVPKYQGIELFGPFDVIKRNLKYLSSTTITVVLGLVFGYLIFVMIKNRKKKINVIENLKKMYSICCYILFPIIWYLVIKQHSYTHVNFTYRLLVIPLICFMIMAVKILKSDNKVI